jgi:AraC-like DNA-binding protein
VPYLQETVRGARVHRRGLDSQQLELVTAAIAEKIDEPISVSMLSSVVGLSRSYFSHAFRRSVGLTPHAHIVRLRIERAMTLMVHTEASLSEVAQAVGFADQSHFSRAFRRLTGVTPAHWRRAHNDASVTPRDWLSSQPPDWPSSRQAI